MNLQQWPAWERPREKLLAAGAQQLSDAELLALLLGGSGLRGSNVVDLARGLLCAHHSLRELLSADRASLLATRGLGEAGYCRLQAALELARRHYAEALRSGPLLDSPAATHRFLIARLRDQPHELFCCLHLDLCGPLQNVELGVFSSCFSAFGDAQLHITLAFRDGVTSRLRRSGRA